MSKEGWKKEKKKKTCGFHKAEKKYIDWCLQPRDVFCLCDYKTVLFLASQGFARMPYQSTVLFFEIITPSWSQISSN